MTITFKSLRDAYPVMPKPQLFAQLGGQWPGLVADDNYKNTCAIRLSVALRKAGATIPTKYKEAIDGTGAALVVKVKTMGLFVQELLHKPYWGVSKLVGSDVRIPGVQGIIVYHAAWSNATGHFDLWTGSGFVGAFDLNDVADGYDIALWSLA